MSLVHLSPTQVTNTAKLSSWTVTNSTLENSFKLMKYASAANAAKIDISTITLNGGTELTQTTLFSIEGTVANLDLTTLLFDTSTTIGDSSAVDQTGEVTGTLTVDDVKITGHAPMTATLGTAALFKFTGVCSTIEFTNFVMKD